MLSSVAAAAVRGTRSIAANPDVWVPIALTVALVSLASDARRRHWAHDVRVEFWP